MASRWAMAPVAGFPVKMGSSSFEMAIEAGAWGRTGTGWPRAMAWAARQASRRGARHLAVMRR
jgi:hypothetical protein